MIYQSKVFNFIINVATVLSYFIINKIIICIYYIKAHESIAQIPEVCQNIMHW